MKVIRQLDKHLVNKIAAGEVVERPLSVVKELTENAIDAGAGILTVEIKDGGLSTIRVTDNGSGIPADQIDLAFAQHATSKITDIEDLDRIGTLGFRGEALASIASVSLVEMITKTTGAISGTRVELHGGTVIARQELGCSEGTTINVSNLFFNTPARLKFLKRPATEAGYVTDLMQRLALGYPGLAFRYISNGQVMITTNGNGDLKTAIYHIYGKDVARGLLSIACDGFVSGYIGKSDIARGSRSAENFFINGRYIKSNLLQDAVEEVYKSRLPVGRFPLCVLHLQVPPEQVDVNVHPAKMEVRFADEREVYGRVTEALNKVLSANELIPTFKVSPTAAKSLKKEKYKKNYELAERIEQIEIIEEVEKVKCNKNIERQDREWEANDNRRTRYFDSREKPKAEMEYSSSISLAEESLASTSPKKSHDFTILNQIFNTYWLAARSDELFLIDQHAAHERILYEEKLSLLKNKSFPSQQLLDPITIPLSPKELEIALEHKQILEGFSFGFEIIKIDDEKIAMLRLLAVPMILKGPMPSAFFTELLDKLEVGGESAPSIQIREQLAMAACKAAVKGLDVLSVEEAKRLVERMLVLENPYTCPHGRPTMIKLTRKEIERMFKRA